MANDITKLKGNIPPHTITIAKDYPMGNICQSTPSTTTMEFAKSEIASSDVSDKHVAVIIPDYYMIQQLAVFMIYYDYYYYVHI